MKKGAKRGYFRDFLGVLKDSVMSLRTNIFVMALHDLLFYTCSFYLIVFWNYLARLLSANVQLNPGSFDPTNPTMVNGAVSSMQNFMIFLGVSLLILAVIIVFVYTFFKGMIWLNMLKRKPEYRFFKRFALLNCIWFFSVFLIILVLAIVLRVEFAAYVLVIAAALALHFGINITAQYAKTCEIKESFYQGLKKGLRLHLFILPYIIVLSGYALVLQIGRIFTPLGQAVNFTVFATLTLLYFAWTRIYIFKLVQSIK